MNREIVPPHSVDAEQAVLGGLLLAPEAWDRIVDRLTEADFYRHDHRVIFRAIAELAAADKPRDAVTLGEWFEANGTADEVGGARYVLQLANSTPSAANILAYADIVREKSILRQLIQIGAEISGSGMQPEGRSAKEIIAEAEQKVFLIAESGARGREASAGGIAPMRTAMREWFELLNKRYQNPATMTGVATPWKAVNEKTCGLQPAELIVVAGRPSMGKTAFALGLVGRAAQEGVGVAMFSLEMKRSQIIGRVMSSAGGILYRHLRNPRELVEEEWARVTGTMTGARDWPLYIDDSSTITVDRLVARTRRLHAKNPIGLVVIDYLQLIDLPANAERRDVGFGMVTKALKALAKDLNCPVVCLSQLNRGLEARSDKRPMMSDLRESGAIEQDADVIAFLYRDDYYYPETHLQGVSEIIFAKQREGETGTVHLRHNFPTMQFIDWEGPLPSRTQETNVVGPAGGFRKRRVGMYGNDARATE